jgi:hypothetical protein
MSPCAGFVPNVCIRLLLLSGLVTFEGNKEKLILSGSRQIQVRIMIELYNNITQVPCLVVDGVPMLESDDIIAYLEGVLK